MAITRGATVSTAGQTTGSSTSNDITHTVDTGTTLLIVTVGLEAGETMSAVPQWSLGGGENTTLINQTTSSGDNADQHNYVYGLVNPTAGAGTVSVDFTTTDNCVACAVNYLGTETASVAAATNFDNEDVNDATSATTVLASGGSAPNWVLACANFRGADGTPASSGSDAFTELADFESGGGGTSTDTSMWVGDKAAPAGTTITWSETDENAGQLIEIVAAASGGPPPGISSSGAIGSSQLNRLR